MWRTQRRRSVLGEHHPEFTYLGASIQADFELPYEALAPYMTEVLDQATPLEGAGVVVNLVDILNGKVKVW